MVTRPYTPQLSFLSEALPLASSDAGWLLLALVWLLFPCEWHLSGAARRVLQLQASIIPERCIALPVLLLVMGLSLLRGP